MWGIDIKHNFTSPIVENHTVEPLHGELNFMSIPTNVWNLPSSGGI